MGGDGQRQPNVAALLLFVFWVLAVVGCLVGALFTPNADIALYGSVACLIVTVPMLRRDYDWVSPWSLVVLAIYIGCGARGFAILDLGLDHPTVNRLYLRGKDVAEYQGPATWFLIGNAVMTVGYMVGRRRPGAAPSSAPGRRVDRGLIRARPPRPPYRFSKLFWPVVIGCAVVGFWAFLRYAAATGGLDLSNFSAKRTGFYVSEGRYAGGAGQWRTLNELASIAFWLTVAKFASTGARMALVQKAGLLILFANAALLPFYSSTRSQIIYIVLTALVVQVCLRGRISMRVLGKTGIAAVLILAISTFMRQQSEGSREAFNASTALRSVSDAMLINLNFSEVPKAVNVIASVPEHLAYSYGSTMTNYLLAWVPRSVWPEKPIIDPGVAVGVLVYHTDGTAVPPGAIAEFYWAWGAGTLVIGSFLLGFTLRRLYELSRRHTAGVAGALIYATAIFALGGDAVSGSVGYAFSSALMAAVMMAVVLKLAGTREPPPAPTRVRPGLHLASPGRSHPIVLRQLRPRPDPPIGCEIRLRL